ncbi:MAG: hypothetical protein AAFY85_08135, partial [Pseudomonadota bacterium]
AEERAQALRDWRSNCADEDPDLRLIYVEDAVTTQGGTIARICARSALKSDDPDARALGLRAALFMNDTLIIPFDTPMAYQEEISEAGDNEGAIERVNDDWKYVIDTYDDFGASFTFRKEDASLDSGSSEWTLQSQSGRFDENQSPIRIMVTSDSVRIDGRSFGNSLSINLTLDPVSGYLSGQAIYDGRGPYPVTVELL